MTAEQAQKLVQRLIDAFPQTEMRTQTPNIYTQMLRDLDHGRAEAVVTDLIATATDFPTIADIRRQVINEELKIPTPLEAWASITEPKREGEEREVHELTGRVRELFGGSWSIKNSDNPSITRAQFLKTYEEFREEELRRANRGRYRRSA